MSPPYPNFSTASVLLHTVSFPSNLRFCHYQTHLFSSTVAASTSLALSPSPNLQTSPSSSGSKFFREPSSISSSGSRIGPPMASSTPITGSGVDSKPFSVLFVCLGNICRSPAAEGVFRDIVKKRGLDSRFKIDSAGTIDYHEGNPSDSRMRAASKRRNIEITSLSRPIRPSDMRDFDLILAMDNQNKDDIIEMFNRSKRRDPLLPEDAHKKVKLMCSYCKRHDETEVPDPYYGGPQGFEKVLDILEDACDSLLESILAENRHILG